MTPVRVLAVALHLTPVRWAAAPVSAPILLAPAAPERPALSAAAAQPRTSREIARDEAAARLSAAGFPEAAGREGLSLWRVLRHRSRSGEQVHLTLGLPLDGRPFERGSGDPDRVDELKRRVARAEAQLVALAAKALGVAPSAIVLNERLIESCCGVGCEACLVGKR